ncbi:MAG TPA: HEAT repeat domain-containing protein [Candidatus Acidoferrum sp.]|nr:HEAT repeat domain-containing protein [Candidatus Acidoferrum sp.]
MDERFQSDRPIDQPATVSRGLRLAIVSSAIVFPITFCILLRPTAAHAAWIEFARIIQLKGQPAAPAASLTDMPDSNIAALHPQQQAELLLQAAVNHSGGASDQIVMRAGAWRGHLRTTPQLSGLLNTALNSPHLDVRTAAVETELAANNLAKTPRSAKSVAAQIESDPAARPWGLWMLGALGNRGVESDRSFATLVAYTRDPNEKTRYWAVEGLSVLGTDEAIQPLLEVLRSDSSPEIRERAACGLAQSGTFTKRQRMIAVPSLIDDAGDPSLDAATHGLTFRALRDITGARVDDNASAWRNYWAENAQR